MLNIHFNENELQSNDTIAILTNDKLDLDKNAMELDQKHHGIISKTINDKKKFKGDFASQAMLNISDENGDLKTIIIVSLGNEGKLQEFQLEEIGGKIYSSAKMSKAEILGIKIDDRIGNFNEDKASALIASGAKLAAYSFDKYFTKKEDKIIIDFNLIVKDTSSAQKAFENYNAIADAVHFARNLVSEVPNVLYPASYAEEIATNLGALGVKVEVLGERELRDLGMGAMLGVGIGSTHESQLVVMTYNGREDGSKPVCFVGKGVTFDTGGISLKPAGRMHEMKYDMGGSASVVGVIHALAARKANVNIVGVVGLVENMPGGAAQRPGDVVKTMSGKTVEILNTDAEGRLVLCDCVTYLQKHFDPECIIDLATLTGAIVVALGNTYAGCFANNDELAERLNQAGSKSNEKVWRLPLHKDFDKMIKSDCADIANIGNVPGAAGSSTAAHFVGRFIDEGQKWAHLDIAGMAWDKTGTNPICPKGASGYGVRLLNRFVADNYEN